MKLEQRIVKEMLETLISRYEQAMRQFGVVDLVYM